MCPEGTYWSEEACTCFSEIQCTQMCGPGFQLDPRAGCSCIRQHEFDAIFENCENTNVCPDGQVWSDDLCICVAEVQCMMMCPQGQQLDPRYFCSCVPQASVFALNECENNGGCIGSNCGGGVSVDVDISTEISVNVDEGSCFSHDCEPPVPG